MSMRTTVKKVAGDELSPLMIFSRLSGKQKFLLESSSKHDGPGRYSFMGMNPLKSFQGYMKARKNMYILVTF